LGDFAGANHRSKRILVTFTEANILTQNFIKNYLAGATWGGETDRERRLSFCASRSDVGGGGKALHWTKRSIVSSEEATKR